MTINERIRALRKDYLKMNQTDFAVLIGMKQTSVSSFEKSGATVTDQTIKGICLAVNGLNEDWLRFGSEPMILEPSTFSLDTFVKSRGMTDFELEIFKTYFDLDPDIRKMLVEHFRKGLSSPSVAQQSHDYYADCPSTPEELERQFPPIKKSSKQVG